MEELKRLLEIVCREMDVRSSAVLLGNTTGEVVMARKYFVLFTALLRPELRQKQIGDFLGVEASSVTYSYKTIARLINTTKMHKRHFDHIINVIDKSGIDTSRLRRLGKIPHWTRRVEI